MNNLSRRLFHSMSKCPRIQKRLQQTNPMVADQVTRNNYDGPGKTTVSFLNEEADAGLLIDSYSQLGFRLSNGIFVVGPIALFPKSVLSWNVPSMKEVTPQAMELFFALDPKIDILVLGMGDEAKLDLRLMKEFKRRGLNIEALPTDRACSTFNFLNSEFRYVAGAIIPPDNVRTNTEDLFGSITDGNRKSLTAEMIFSQIDKGDVAGSRDKRTKRILDATNSFDDSTSKPKTGDGTKD